MGRKVKRGQAGKKGVKGRGCQGKEGECEGWTWRDIPLKSNTPPQPSRSPRRAEETSHSASKGTKGQVKEKT